jgi:hypothetical protein
VAYWLVLPGSQSDSGTTAVLVDEPISTKVVRKNGDLLLLIAVTFFSTCQLIALYELALYQLVVRLNHMLPRFPTASTEF